MSASVSKPTAAVITALPIERQAVLAHLREREVVEHEAGTHYSVGCFDGENETWRVFVAEVGMGNVSAAVETERVIQEFSPSHCLFVGVAGGLKDVSIGDVVASSKVYGYELGKAREDFAPRPDFGSPTHALVQKAKTVAEEESWLLRIQGRSQSDPCALVAPIAAGEKVVASKKSDIYRLLKENFSDAVAIEMEGYGFFKAVHANHAVKAIAVRGISDLIEGKKEADASGSQDLAAQHAAAFAFEILAQIESPPKTADGKESGHLNGDDAREIYYRLVPTAVELYPQGPGENQIWARAGGSLGFLSLEGSGKAKWFEALQELKKGGGGSEITLESLLNTMSQDYPSNGDLARLEEKISG